MIRYHIVTHITLTLTLTLHIVTLTLPRSICLPFQNLRTKLSGGLYNLQQILVSLILTKATFTLGSITSRCLGNEPTLTPREESRTRGSGENRAVRSLCTVTCTKLVRTPCLPIHFEYNINTNFIDTLQRDFSVIITITIKLRNKT